MPSDPGRDTSSSFYQWACGFARDRRLKPGPKENPWAPGWLNLDPSQWPWPWSGSQATLGAIDVRLQEVFTRAVPTLSPHSQVIPAWAWTPGWRQPLPRAESGRVGAVVLLVGPNARTPRVYHCCHAGYLLIGPAPEYPPNPIGRTPD